MSADYKIVSENAVAEFLDRGYELYGQPFRHHRDYFWLQVVVRLPAKRTPMVDLSRLPDAQGTGNPPPQHSPSTCGQLGGIRPTIDLSDVSLELVDNKVYDVDGTELLVGDRVMLLNENGLVIGSAVIHTLDPVFSKIRLVGDYGYSSTQVRFEYRNQR